MSLKTYPRKVTHYLKKISIRKDIPDSYWADKIWEFHLNSSRFDIDIKSANTELILKDFDISILKDKHLFLLSGIYYAQQLKELAGGQFSVCNDEIIVKIESCSFIVQTEEELYILYEIFVEGIYNFLSLKPVIVWDIGMNTGFASLYFAAKENVVNVLSYEPFKKTYDQGQKNFTLNPSLTKKIKSYNFGLAELDKELIVDYCYEWKGSLGINGVPQRFKKTSNISQEKMILQDVCRVLDSILLDYPNTDIVAKIDCEGSEYEIIEALWNGGRLNSLTNIMLEWHDFKRNQKLIDCLNKSGFQVIYLNPTTKGTTGILYASRT